jgi:hypothetical protein
MASIIGKKHNELLDLLGGKCAHDKPAGPKRTKIKEGQKQGSSFAIHIQLE